MDDEQREIEELLSRGSAARSAARFGRRGRKSLYEAPEFTKRLSAFTEAQAGEEVKFECMYKGFPNATLRWYKDDEMLGGDERYMIEEGSGYAVLSITKVGKNDEAAYKCKAENSEGVTSTTGYLSVLGDNSDRPLSCQGGQSEHAVSHPPPLRTIIEQKSMEEREEDAYPQASTSPVDEILEEAALKGHGWPAMLGLKKKRKDKRRAANDEDYDSGSDTSVESQQSQQDGRPDRERTPDTDLVIDEANLLPGEGPITPITGGSEFRNDQNPGPAGPGLVDPGQISAVPMETQDGIVQNGGTVVPDQFPQQESNPMTDSGIQNGDMMQISQNGSQVESQNPSQFEKQNVSQNGQIQSQNPSQSQSVHMQVTENQAPTACQVGQQQAYPQDIQMVQQEELQQQAPNFETQNPPPPYEAVVTQVKENNVVPEMQTAPAMASPVIEQAMASPVVEQALESPVVEQAMASPEVEQFGDKLSKEIMQSVIQAEMQPEAAQVAVTQQSPEIQNQMHTKMAMTAPQQTEQVQMQVAAVEPQEAEAVQKQVVQGDQQAPQAPLEASPESRDDSPIGTLTPNTEKQKSIESGYSTEDLDVAIQQEAANTAASVMYTETMEVPVVRGGQQQDAQNTQQATVILSQSGQTTPEVHIGSPVNLQVSFGGGVGLPIGIELGGAQPQVLAAQGASSEEPDGLAQDAPPEVIAQPVLASPQVYQSPTNFVSLESAEVQQNVTQVQEPSQQVQQSVQPQQQQSVTHVQYVSNDNLPGALPVEQVGKPQVYPQRVETVHAVQAVQAQPLMSQEVTSGQMTSQAPTEMTSQQQQLPQQPITEEIVSNEASSTSFSSATNPFRGSSDNLEQLEQNCGENEEMLATYTRTFSSTIEEDEQQPSQSTGETIIIEEIIEEPTVQHSDEITTLVGVETTLRQQAQPVEPFHDWLPFPWLPVSLLVTVSALIGVVFEISPSIFILVIFLLSFIAFRLFAKENPKPKPKDD